MYGGMAKGMAKGAGQIPQPAMGAMQQGGMGPGQALMQGVQNTPGMAAAPGIMQKYGQFMGNVGDMFGRMGSKLIDKMGGAKTGMMAGGALGSPFGPAAGALGQYLGGKAGAYMWPQPQTPMPQHQAAMSLGATAAGGANPTPGVPNYTQAPGKTGYGPEPAAGPAPSIYQNMY